MSHTKLGGGGQGSVHSVVVRFKDIEDRDFASWVESVSPPCGEYALFCVKHPKETVLPNHLRRESRLLARSAGPYVPSVAPGTSQTNAWFAMEHVLGVSGRQLFSKPSDGDLADGRFEGRFQGGPSLVTFAVGLWHAIRDLHSKYVYHRDLSWANYLVPTVGLASRDHSGQPERGLLLANPVLIDLGFGYHHREDLTDEDGYKLESRGPGGTPGFQPPEQAAAGPEQEHLHQARDIFQWGCNVYAAAVGEPPWRRDGAVPGKEADKLNWVALRTAGLEHAVRTALQAEPLHRDVEEIDRALETASLGARTKSQIDQLRERAFEAERHLRRDGRANASPADAKPNDEASPADPVTERLLLQTSRQLDAAKEELNQATNQTAETQARLDAMDDWQAAATISAAEVSVLTSKLDHTTNENRELQSKINQLAAEVERLRRGR